MNKDKTLFIAFDIFNKTGGIQKVCRTMCYTLDKICEHKENLKIHSLNDNLPDKRYIWDECFTGFKGDTLSFIYKTIKEALRSKTIILSHLHLVPLLIIVKTFNRKCRIILIAHGTEFWRKLNIILLIFIRKKVEVWAVSRFTRESIINRHQLIGNRIYVLNNCLDPYFKIPVFLNKPTTLLNRYRLSPDQSILLTMCRITEHEKAKGYDLILNILPELSLEFPDLHYLICGHIHTKELHRLDIMIRELKIEKLVTFTGFIPENELTDHYLLADGFVMPSKKEGFGIVFIEAIACGCDVIAGNSDGSADALLDGKLGRLVNQDNARELKVTLLNILQSKSLKTDKLRKQTMCVQHFSQATYQKKIKSLLK